MQFDKPPLTLSEQINRLLDRGLHIPDRAKAAHYLGHLNYYRLGAYWLPFEGDHTTHQFVLGTTLDQVIDLYVFDREFRLIVLDAIERIEISIRSAWAYEMAHRHGPHCQLNRALFKVKWNYSRYLQSAKNEVSRSKETFILHLTNKYDEELPPTWAMVEVMSFGQLSNWYSNTRYRQDRNAIAARYGLDEKILTSLLHHLTIVRNTCAHHARLWNREFPVIPKLPKDSVPSLSQNHKRKIYNTLVLVLYLLDQISPGHHWRMRLLNLLHDSEVNVRDMGFPDNWQESTLWIAPE